MHMNSFKSSYLSDSSKTVPKFLKKVTEQKVACINMERHEHEEYNKITENDESVMNINIEETKNNNLESLGNRVSTIMDYFGEMDSYIREFSQQMRLINNEMSSINI
jgi:hypothetical protein